MATEQMVLPDKLTFKLKEVMQITKLDARVLDFWEKEFGVITPIVNQSGEKFYSRRDLELIVRIKQWLIIEKRDKSNVKELLQQEESFPQTREEESVKTGRINHKKLQKLRSSLNELLTLLDKHDKTKQ